MLQPEHNLNYSFFEHNPNEELKKDQPSHREEQTAIRLPTEPDVNTEDTINLNFRLPVTGERVSRRFKRTDKVELLYDFIDFLT